MFRKILLATCLCGSADMSPRMEQTAPDQSLESKQANNTSSCGTTVRTPSESDTGSATANGAQSKKDIGGSGIQDLLKQINSDDIGVNPTLEFMLKESSIETFKKLFAEFHDKISRKLPSMQEEEKATLNNCLKEHMIAAAHNQTSAACYYAYLSDSELQTIEEYYETVADTLRNSIASLKTNRQT